MVRARIAGHVPGVEVPVQPGKATHPGGFFSTAFGGQRGKGEAPFGGGDDLALMD